MTHSATTGRGAARTADGEGEAYWFYGAEAVLRSPDGVLPVIIEHHVGPGAAAPLHLHHHVNDSFYLLRGQLAMRCGDDTFVASAAGDERLWQPVSFRGRPLPRARDQRSAAAQPTTPTMCSTRTRAKGWSWYCG